MQAAVIHSAQGSARGNGKAKFRLGAAGRQLEPRGWWWTSRQALSSKFNGRSARPFLLLIKILKLKALFVCPPIIHV